MTENIIYYGPPGTGKTFKMQELLEQYKTYNISDTIMIETFKKFYEPWVLVTLILLQNNNEPMSIDILQQKIDNLNLGVQEVLNGGVSTILVNHSVKKNDLFPLKDISPSIFKEFNNKWYVSIDRLYKEKPMFLKTYALEDVLRLRYKFVTFHPSFSYEDFVEGIKPNMNESGDIKYHIEDGIFKKICKEAAEDPTNSYAIFIDEINRGNISEIFGELITLIEVDKRLGCPNELQVNLPYSKEVFGVPANLDIVGTMNSADKSISLIDIALRRRFRFKKQRFNYEVLKRQLENREISKSIDVALMVCVMNKRIGVLLNEEYELGHAYFLGINNLQDLNNIMIDKIIPLLEDYFSEDLQKIQFILNDLQINGEVDENAIYQCEEIEVEDLFIYSEDIEHYSTKRYYVNDILTKASYTKIYEKSV